MRKAIAIIVLLVALLFVMPSMMTAQEPGAEVKPGEGDVGSAFCWFELENIIVRLDAISEKEDIIIAQNEEADVKHDIIIAQNDVLIAQNDIIIAQNEQLLAEMDEIPKVSNETRIVFRDDFDGDTLQPIWDGGSTATVNGGYATLPTYPIYDTYVDMYMLGTYPPSQWNVTDNVEFASVMKVGSDISDMRIRSGFNHAHQYNQYVYFYYDNTSSPNWSAVMRGTLSRIEVDTGVQVLPDTTYIFEINMNASEINFWLDGYEVASMYDYLPNKPLRIGTYVFTSEAVSKRIHWDYVEVEGDRSL